MIQNLIAIWRMVHAPLERPEKYTRGSARDIWQVFYRFYAAQYWGAVALVIGLSAATGLIVYAYSWAGCIVADDVVQVQLIERDSPQAYDVDPSTPGERRRFAFVAPAEPAGNKQEYAHRAGRTDSERLALLGGLLAMIIAVEVLRHGLSMIMLERTVFIGQQFHFRLRQNLYHKLQRLPLTYHDRHSPGRLMTHLFSDVQSIQYSFLRLLRTVPAGILAMIVGLLIVFTINPRMAVLAVLALPTYFIAYRWFRSRMRTTNRNLRDRESKVNGMVANRINNFHVVKSFSRETGEALTFLREGRPLLRYHLASGLLSTAFGSICGVISALCTTAVLWLGVLHVRDGTISLGQMLLFYASMAYLFTPVTTIAQTAGIYHHLCVVCGRVMSVVNEPITLADPVSPVPAPIGLTEVRFEQVTHQYTEDAPPALREVSFTVPAGRRLAVMGASGAGKSTIAKLMARLYDPTEGRILIGGVDIRRLKIADLRSTVGYVGQEPVVFSGTIEQNIRYGSQSAKPQAVIAAAQYAQIHDFIEQLPNQYTTTTQERGLTLSGGQKQRVNLARALLQNPLVLVLDDCTSAVDAETELRLIDTFKTVMSRQTSIAVTHRVSVAMACDLVLVVAEGRRIEFGPPAELLGRNGPFARMHEEQTKAQGLQTLQLNK